MLMFIHNLEKMDDTWYSEQQGSMGFLLYTTWSLQLKFVYLFKGIYKFILEYSGERMPV